MSAVYLSTAYLAPIQYYSKLARFDKICMETKENYAGQTFRNRCIIAAANGVQTLTVPVEKPETLTCPTQDIRISNHGNWRHLHWNALLSAYNRSPFFAYYADDFRPFYEEPYRYLIEYNEAFRTMICDILDIHPAVTHTEKYEPEVENDFRTVIDPRHPKPDTSFISRPYCQVFRHRHGFIPNLSIVDLLFNMGPESVLFL
jgi:hypothetical protein